MTWGFDVPVRHPRIVGAAIFYSVDNGRRDLPDPTSSAHSCPLRDSAIQGAERATTRSTRGTLADTDKSELGVHRLTRQDTHEIGCDIAAAPSYRLGTSYSVIPVPNGLNREA